MRFVFASRVRLRDRAAAAFAACTRWGLVEIERTNERTKEGRKERKERKERKGSDAFIFENF